MAVLPTEFGDKKLDFQVSRTFTDEHKCRLEDLLGREKSLESMDL